ncbi:MAG: hypothetical protein WA431_01490 [Candidatus Cybelea sp.]
MIRTIVIITAAAALCACTSSLPQGSMKSAEPASASGGYTWYSISYSGATQTQVTGIADNQDIVGVYTKNNVSHAFTAKNKASGYPTLVPNDYPDDAGTYLSSIMASSSKDVEAGYAVSPGAENGTWGVIDNGGLWTLLQKFQKVAKCHMMEIFGIDTSYDAVGFFQKPKASGNVCDTTQQYALLAQRNEQYTNEGQPLNENYPVATGISNTTKLMVGYTSNNTQNGPYTGWSMPAPYNSAKAVAWHCCSASSTKSTQILGINDEIVSPVQDWAVGTYLNNSKWQGFILKNMLGTPTWEPLNYNNSNLSTVISGIDKHGDLCGWYTTSGGATLGFVAINKAGD